ncbi:MAG: Yip1 family protein [Myxococcota bacterium]|jgi:MFS family permease|nr:Yip1 family protein [Myxococcota bacterium]
MSETAERDRTREDFDDDDDKASPLILGNIKPRKKGTQQARWIRFLKRLLHVLLRPQSFWEDALEDRHQSLSEILFPHTVVLIFVRALAGFVGALLGGSTFAQALANFGSSLLSWFALVFTFAFIVGFVVSARGGQIGETRAWRYAAYGLAPLFAVGIFAAIPLPYVAPVAELIAMPYTFYVMGLGLVPIFGLKAERAPALVGLLCGLLLVLWGVMPTLVPIVVHALTH